MTTCSNCLYVYGSREDRNNFLSACERVQTGKKWRNLNNETKKEYDKIYFKTTYVQGEMWYDEANKKFPTLKFKLLTINL